MKIFIFTDLEGASGVYRFEQTRERQNAYHEAVGYLMDDIASVVKGLREAGVEKIIVLDGHGDGQNFIPCRMVSGAKYIVGAPPCEKWGLDRSCDGVIMLGYHAMCGTDDGVLHHTQSSKTETRYWYNGVESGELVQAALYAGHFGVPPIMATGDEATCREARAFFGENCITVAVKKGVSREAAILYPFEETRQTLYESAKRAITAIPLCKPYRLKLPMHVKKEYFAFDQHPSQTRLVRSEKDIADISNISNIL